MKKTNKDAPKWQKVTSSLLTAVLLTQISLPVFASVKASVTFSEIQEAVTSSERYELQTTVRDYLYSGRLEAIELGIFDGFTYFFNVLKESRPDITIDSLPARFGSPQVERGVIKDQLTQILNKAWISAPGYSSYNEQTKNLYHNAALFAQSKGLKIGQPLTHSQINQLSTDIVWPEVRKINGRDFLVPFVYLSKETIKSQRLIESIFSMNTAYIQANNFVLNGAHIEFKREALIDIKNDFINTQGKIAGRKFTIRTGRELQNLSGTISGDDVTLIAGRLTNDTLVTRTDFGHGYSETFRDVGTISSIGDLNIHTAGDLISHGGQFSAQGDLQIQSNGNIILVPQVARSEREESGKHWSDSESSLVNLQTSLSAIDTLSLIAGGEVFLQGAALESQGLLEIIAGHGITLKSAADLKSFSKKFEAKSSGVFGTKVSQSESKSEAEIVRTLLKAGQSLLLSTRQGNVLLEAVTVDSKGLSHIIAENGSIDFELAKLLETYSYSSSYEGSLSYRHKGNGYQREVAYYSEFINSGGLLLDAATGVRIEVATGTNDLNQTLSDLAVNPDLAWMLDIRNDPQYRDVDWESIELVMEQWDYDESGLSPAAMSILAVAMAVAMGPGGLALAGTGAGATITVSNAVLAAAINAGFSSIVVQASGSLLGNGFDVKDTLSQLGSKESLKSLATSMVVAGVLSGLNDSLFTEGSTGASTLEDLTSINIAADSWQAQAVQAVFKTTVSSGLTAVINGQNLTEFGDSFIQSIAMTSVSLIGEKLANEISELADTTNGKQPDIGTAAQYIAHAALGCGLGGATASIQGGNSDTNRNGCASGAAGGVIGEYVATQYKNDIIELENDTQVIAEKLVNKVVDANGSDISPQELKQALQDLRTRGVDISRLAAGLAIFAAGGNVDIATDAAGNAAANNALLLVLLASPEALALFTATFTAWSATQFVMSLPEAHDKAAEIYRMYTLGDANEQEQAKQAMIDLAIDLGIDTATSIVIGGVAVKVANKTVFKDASFEEIADYLAVQFNRQDHHAVGDVFKNIGDKVKYKDAQYDYYKEGGGHEDYATWSKNYDSDNYHSLKEPSKAIQDSLDRGDVDYSAYERYKESYPNTSITPERFAVQYKKGFTLGEKGHWRSRDTRQKNVPDAPEYKAKKTALVDPNDHSAFMDREVQLPNGKTARVEELIRTRADLFKEIKALESQSLDGNRDRISAMRAEGRNLSETLGLARLEHNLHNEFVSVKRLAFETPGGAQHGQFDGLYEVTDKNGMTKLISGEAKGGLRPQYRTRQVGKDARGQIIDAQQGSPAYHNSIWDNMKKRYDAAMRSKKYSSDPNYREQTDELGKTLRLFRKYSGEGQTDFIEYRGAELIFNKDGTIKTSNNVKFELGA